MLHMASKTELKRSMTNVPNRFQRRKQQRLHRADKTELKRSMNLKEKTFYQN